MSCYSLPCVWWKFHTFCVGNLNSEEDRIVLRVHLPCDGHVGSPHRAISIVKLHRVQAILVLRSDPINCISRNSVIT